MGKYTGPVCRLCRREGVHLFLKGTRCLSKKCTFSKRKNTPGVMPKKRVSKLSSFGVSLREKQKVKRMYGVLGEKQFLNCFNKAEKTKGETVSLFLTNLESRFDNIVYRSHFAISYFQSRQLINHKHLLINGKNVDIASYLLKAGDLIQVKSNSKITSLIRDNFRQLSNRQIPSWLEINENKIECKILAMPDHKDLNSNINGQLVVEFYSR